MALEELSSKAGVLRLPPSRDIAFSSRIARIVDHPHFQRMRRVRQLGPIQWVYPGATHTRFEHSLGVYGNVLDYLRSLLQDPNFAQSASEADLTAAMLAGLLHDIGHYPFAHSLEAAHVAGFTPPRHEDLAESFIYGRTLPLGAKEPSIAQLIERDFGLHADDVVQMIRKKPHQHEADLRAMVSSIISSAIDADKSDYLERDAHHMGLPFGSLVDRTRLLRALVPHPNGRSIAIRSHGRMAAESFMFSRYALFSEGYWHHTARAVAAMVEAALTHYRESVATNATDFEMALVRYDDERFLSYILRDPHCPVATRGLLEGISNDHRAPYKRVLTLSLSYEEVSVRAAYEKVFALGREDRDRLRALLSAELERLSGANISTWELLIDVPPRDKDKHEDVDIVDGADSAMSLFSSSQVVRGISADFSKVVKKIRVFVPAWLREKLLQHCDAKDVSRRLLDVILRFDVSAETQGRLGLDN